MSKQNPITTSPAKAHLIPGLVLAAALAASWALALATLGSIQLPGCGPGSSCDKAAGSAWGSLPVLGLPISIVGAAWFTASLAAFAITAIGGVGRGRTLRALWLLSALASVLYLGVIIYHGFWCRMCITVHIANITFVAMIIAAPPAAAAGKHRQLLAILIAFVVGLGTLLTLGRMHHAHQSAVLAERAAQQERSLQEIAAAPSDRAASFSGRYILGPAVARARIVLFTDLCCTQCRQTSFELKTLLARYPQANLSIKHFPLCADCNRGAVSTLHPRACDAAALAEAVGAIGGAESFWKAVDWLYDRLGEFSQPELEKAAAAWGIEAESLASTLGTHTALGRVKSDVEEGLRIGVERTPTIFINGVELHGWETPGAIENAIKTALNAQPAAADAAGDRPLDAAQRAVQLWKDATPVAMTYRPALDPAFISASPVRIVIFGDYQDPFTAEADKILREYALTWPGTLYQFRHFPASTQCNPFVKVNPHPLACRMARAVEAARIISTEAFCADVHAWIFEHQRDYSDAGLRDLAASIGLDPGIMITAQRDARVQAAVEQDVRAGAALGITALPAIFINERPVSIWKTEQGELLSRMLDEAAAASQQQRGPVQEAPATTPR